MRYTVTEDTTAIFPDARQGRLSIINEGPSTVYLDGDASINEQSYPLPPTGTMLWNPGTPLFAKAREGQARLNVNTYGGISDAARAETNDILVTSGFVASTSHVTDTFECGSYQTLFVQSVSADAPTPVVGEHVTWTFSWLDVDGNGLLEEAFIFWSYAGIYQATIPVKGVACQITVTSTNAFTSNYKVFGTSRTLAATQSHYPPAYCASTPLVSRGVVSILTWDKTAVFLPSWGGTIRFTLSVTGAVASDEVVSFKDAYTNQTYHTSIILASASTSIAVRENVIIPRSRGIVFDCDTAPWPNDTSLTFNWSDYT